MFFPLQNVSQNHFQKIGKFIKQISPKENQNIKEQSRSNGKYLSFFGCSVTMTTSYT